MRKLSLEYSGTVLLVSHDRNFLDEIATCVLEIRIGRLFDYPGNYSYFIEKRASQIKNDEENKGEKQLTKTALRQQRKEKSAHEAEKIRRQRELKQVENEIARLEEELKICDEELCRPENFSALQMRELLQSRRRTETELEAMMSRWEALASI